MEFKLPFIAEKRDLKEVYSVRSNGRLKITECKLILNGKQVSFGLARIAPEHYNPRVGKKLALAEAAKIFFKTLYNLTIEDNAEADDIGV